MRVHREGMNEQERAAFEEVVRACGREPGEFRVDVFTADDEPALRRVHVSTPERAAQYEASEGQTWTLHFREHLARGCFQPRHSREGGNRG